MSEQLTADEQILSESSPSPEIAETSEPISPSESAGEPTPAETAPKTGAPKKEFAEKKPEAAPEAFDVQAATEASSRDYFQAADERITSDVEGHIAQTLPANSLPAEVRADVVQAVHFAVQDALWLDHNFLRAIQNLLQGGVDSRVKAVTLFASRARDLVPAAVRKIVQQYGSLFAPKQATAAAAPPKQVVAKKPTPTAGAEAPLSRAELRRLSPREILDIERPIEQEHAHRAPKLTKAEARNLTFADIIRDTREVGEG